MITQGRHGIREEDNDFSSYTGAGLLQRDPTIPVKRHVDEKKTVSVVLPVKGQCSAGHWPLVSLFQQRGPSTPRPVEPFPRGGPDGIGILPPDLRHLRFGSCGMAAPSDRGSPAAKFTSRLLSRTTAAP